MRGTLAKATSSWTNELRVRDSELVPDNVRRFTVPRMNISTFEAFSYFGFQYTSRHSITRYRQPLKVRASNSAHEIVRLAKLSQNSRNKFSLAESISFILSKSIQIFVILLLQSRMSLILIAYIFDLKKFYISFLP